MPTHFLGYAIIGLIIGSRMLGGAIIVKSQWWRLTAAQAVNPDGIKNQIEDGILQSVSWTCMRASRSTEHA